MYYIEFRSQGEHEEQLRALCAERDAFHATHKRSKRTTNNNLELARAKARLAQITSEEF